MFRTLCVNFWLRQTREVNLMFIILFPYGYR